MRAARLSPVALWSGTAALSTGATRGAARTLPPFCFWPSARPGLALSSVAAAARKPVPAQVRSMRDEVKQLRKEYDKTEDDLKALQSVGQIIGEVLRQLDAERYIVKASSGPRYVVGCRSKLDKEKLVQGTRVTLDMTTLTIMRALPREVRAHFVAQAPTGEGDGCRFPRRRKRDTPYKAPAAPPQSRPGPQPHPVEPPPPPPARRSIRWCST